MSEFSAPFIVETTFRLPGLGLLVLPASPEPSWLLTCSLHTALTIVLPASMHHPASVLGTIEEVSRSDQPQRRALLLDFDPSLPLPLGSCLLGKESSSELY